MNRTPAGHWILAVTLLLISPGAVAQSAGGFPGEGGPYQPFPDSEPIEIPRGERPCDLPPVERRPEQTIEGVLVQESHDCEPDNPELVAAFVRGTNNIPVEMADRLGLSTAAVVKSNDTDGDGDPDDIHITLEIAELNGWHLSSDDIAGDGYAVGPGIKPGFWVFRPKAAKFHGGVTEEFTRMPSAPIRVEQGDRVQITLENTHYFPHTIHLHGVDHPFQDADGEGNDGVPGASEMPVLPGQKRTYEFTARHAGSMFMHCHVQPDVHVLMGLNNLLIIEEDRPDNWVQTFNPGAGQVRAPSKAVQESYDREYDLHYQDIDSDLNDLIRSSPDPRVVSQRMHRLYDSTERQPDLFLLNGKVFPYTLRESIIHVAANETELLHVVNAGSHPLSLHPHGHKPTVVAYDGVKVEGDAAIQRDVFTLTAAQRIDLALDTTDDGLNSYGAGAWFMHDHHEEAVTNRGIGPGGDITAIVYDGFADDNGLPKTAGDMGWNLFFNEAYYRGEIPVFAQMGMENAFGHVTLEPIPSPAESAAERTPFVGPALLGTLLLLGLVARRRQE